jgi:hypothetical protein
MRPYTAATQPPELGASLRISTVPCQEKAAVWRRFSNAGINHLTDAALDTDGIEASMIEGRRWRMNVFEIQERIEELPAAVKYR